jgi:hypothetical protein
VVVNTQVKKNMQKIIFVQNTMRAPCYTEKSNREYPQQIGHLSEKVNCSLVAIHYTLKRLGWRYKKNRYEPVNKTEQM